MAHNVLSGLANGQNTNLSKGTIRNADAVLLLLNEAGGMAYGRDLKAQLRDWRPGNSYGYLFQSHQPGSGYGFMGTHFGQDHNVVSHQPTVADPYMKKASYRTSVRRTYYYRSARGLYAISAEGYKRLGELGIPRHS